MTDNRISEQDQTNLSQANSLHFLERSGSEGESELSSISCNGTSKAVQISSNIWPSKRIGKELKKRAARSTIHGVEIRTLPEKHFLAGQTGLFASNAFQQFSIVGEYCGQVVRPGPGGEYFAALERDKPHETISVNAQTFGNECRTINHYENIAEDPNVIMKVCYVEELPRIMIVCMRDIAIGEEILLNYGKNYFWECPSGKEHKDPPAPVSWNELAGHG